MFFVYTGGNCKTRWNNIRNNFRKSLSKRRTTSGQSSKKMKQYRFESQLQFLLKYMEECKAEGNIGCPDTEYAEIDNDDEAKESQTTDTSNSPEIDDILSSSAVVFTKPVRKKNTQPEAAASTLMKYILKEEKKSSTSGQPTVTLDNPIDCFLFGISPTLKLLPPYLQNLAKTEIFSTVQKFELHTMQMS
jgi:hypothetical protein